MKVKIGQKHLIRLNTLTTLALLLASCSPEEPETSYSYCEFRSFEIGGSDNIFGMSYDGSKRLTQINVDYGYDYYASQYEEIINTEFLKNEDIFELTTGFRSVSGTFKFTYNSLGKVDMVLKQMAFYDSRDFFMLQEYYYDTLVYNSSGQLTEVYRLPERKKPLIRHEYEGGVLKRSYINTSYPFVDTGQYVAEYTIDASNNITQRVVTQNGSSYMTENYTYDASFSFFQDKCPQYLNIMWLVFPNYLNFHDFYTPMPQNKVLSIQRSGGPGGNLQFEYGDEIQTGDLGAIYQKNNNQQVFHVRMNYACE